MCVDAVRGGSGDQERGSIGIVFVGIGVGVELVDLEGCPEVLVLEVMKDLGCCCGEGGRWFIVWSG